MPQEGVQSVSTAQPNVAIVRDRSDPLMTQVLVSDADLLDIRVSLAGILVAHGIDLTCSCRYHYETIGKHGYHVFQQPNEEESEKPK